MAAKPPTPRGETVASVPPATTTSASPYSIMRPASPMQCSPVVQAVTTARFGPLKPKRMDTWPATMLMMEAGTKNGVMRRGRSEEHTSELQSPCNLVCRLLLEKKKKQETHASSRSNVYAV